MSAAAAAANGTPAKPAPAKVAPAANGAEAARTIPYDRFQAVVAEKKALATEIETLRGEVQSVTERAATADTLAAQIQAIKDAHQAEQAAWGEERALLGAGITDAEDADLVRHYYGKAPAEGKPATIADYLAGLRAEGAVVPRGLAHVFAPKVDAGASAGAGAGAGVPPVVPGKPPPKPSVGAGSSATPGTFTTAQLADVRRQAQGIADLTARAAFIASHMPAANASLKKK